MKMILNTIYTIFFQTDTFYQLVSDELREKAEQATSNNEGSAMKMYNFFLWEQLTWNFNLNMEFANNILNLQTMLHQARSLGRVLLDKIRDHFWHSTPEYKLNT